MHTEFEVRVLEVDIKKIEKKLQNIGAVKKWDSIQRRYVYDFNPKQEGKWIRLRSNGIKSTLTIKDITSNKIDGTKELEIEVDSFDNTNKILKELGYNSKAYQENRRVQYDLNGVEIDIDSWPLIPTYLEIEGKSEEDVYKTLELLKISKEKVTSLDVQSIYKNYGINLDDIKELKLEEERL